MASKTTDPRDLNKGLQTSSSAPSISWCNLFKKYEDSKLSFHAQVKTASGNVVKLPKEAVDEGMRIRENCLVGWFVGEAFDF